MHGAYRSGPRSRGRPELGAWSSIAAARPASVKARTDPFPLLAHSRILLATYRRASCPSLPTGRNLQALSSAVSILATIRGPKPSVIMTIPSSSGLLNYIGQIENGKNGKERPTGREPVGCLISSGCSKPALLGPLSAKPPPPRTSRQRPAVACLGVRAEAEVKASPWLAISVNHILWRSQLR